MCLQALSLLDALRVPSSPQVATEALSHLGCWWCRGAAQYGCASTTAPWLDRRLQRNATLTLTCPRIQLEVINDVLREVKMKLSLTTTDSWNPSADARNRKGLSPFRSEVLDSIGAER